MTDETDEAQLQALKDKLQHTKNTKEHLALLVEIQRLIKSHDTKEGSVDFVTP
jgi:hypothetical protein